MSTLVLDVGIGVMFLVVWGLLMVGGYFLGRDDVVEEPTLHVSNSTAIPGQPR